MIVTMKKDKEVYFVGRYEHNEAGSISDAGSFNDQTNTARDDLLDHVIFDTGPKDIEFTPSIMTVSHLMDLGEEYIPTRWDKIKAKIDKIFHPITKWRIRLVNSDYDNSEYGW